jgi:16S rRNA C967 or C1407 C5-methylase (RsmB/RsmF family)/NOL1/NOP2/fmu family ribosome biogenesis protein
MKVILGAEFQKFNDSLSSVIPHSIRINTKKIGKAVDLIPIPTCSTGYYLPQRPIYTLDPLFHAGAYYVQESSSMFLEQFIRHSFKKPLRVLDLCAAPGGKSTHLSSLLPSDSLLVSNEVIHFRALVLSENLKKWGNPNVVVTCNDPRDFSRLPGFFDIIVVDAPCSGEGLFRRDPSAIDEWSDSNASLCAQRQRRILADVWPALAEDGMLVYSTCTYNPAENEENISWLSEFTEVEGIELAIPEHLEIVTTEANSIPCYRFYPHNVPGEGYFTAAVQKKGRVDGEKRSKEKSALPLASRAEQSLLSGLLQQLPLSMVKFEDTFLAFPTNQLHSLDQVKAALRIVHAGVKVGEIKQTSLIPAHELAVSTIINTSHFPSLDLSLEQSIRFLKRDDFRLDFQDQGWNLLTYRSHPLGWAKNIGSRFNNGYPKEWRIRMSTTEYTGEKLAEEAKKFPLNKL